MASVRKRKWTHNGEGREAWVVTYTDQGGKRRLKTFEKKKEADAERLRIENEIEGGIHTAFNESVAVPEAAKEFWIDCGRRRQLGDITRGGEKNYRDRLRRFVERFATRRVSTIRSEEVQAWIEDLRGHLAAATIVGDYKAVTSFLTFCVRRKWVRRSVLRDEPCRLPARTRRKSIPSKADIRQLLETATVLKRSENISTMINRLIVVTCGVFGGLRSSETYGLQWEDCDWERGVLHIRHSYTRINGLRKPKTEAGERTIPMVEPIKRALLAGARYWALRRAEFGDEGKAQNLPAIHARIARMWCRGDTIAVDPATLSGFVVLTRLETPMESTASGSFFWKRLMIDAGLTTSVQRGTKTVVVNKFTPHALRHAAASLLLEYGMDDFNLQRFIGHASIATTKDVYGHILSDRRVFTTTAAIASDLGATTERHGRVSI